MSQRPDQDTVEKPAAPGAAAAKPSPMMEQYLGIKAANPESLLFYRMGDFYELFFDDAVAAARALDITLTRRGKHLGDDIPMCGVPVHSADAYLQRLIRKGFKVAVCEQVEDPAEARKRGSKSVVRREVVRLVTPGTLTEDTLLDARSHNYLAAVARAGGGMALAWLDMSTGDFCVTPVTPATLAHELARLGPGEVVVADRLLEDPSLHEVFGDWAAVLTPRPAACFDSQGGERRLKALYGVAALDAYGDFGRPELAACGALVDYVELTQKGRLPRLKPPAAIAAGAVMAIDAATRRNLELARTLSGERQGSLLSVIDRTVTGAGARALAARLAAPLTDPAAIARRLDMVQFFAESDAMRGGVRAILRRCPDVERALSRLTLGRGGPRDIAAVRDGLRETATLRAAVHGAGFGGLPDGISDCERDLGHHQTLVDRLERALAAELPVLTRDGGFIAGGYRPELDELRTLRDESRRHIAALQQKYAAATGVQSLKVRHNNVLGYFIEVGAGHASKMQAEAEACGFIHRQTMASAVRYTTVELGGLEDRINRAADRALALEMQLFDDLVGEVTARADDIARAAAAMAALDVAAALAELAVERRYCRPEVDGSTAFVIRGGRHPVVEAALAASSDGPFQPNDCNLGNPDGPGDPDGDETGDGGSHRIWLLTGPNMAGKSTFLRQNALIAVLAQAGSYVPADAVRIGVVDRLFSRVGAADDLARGRSTFMVEMVETATILNQAGPRSLVILDEIGRGTATFDGLSIAWAAIEHLHETNRCRAFFATHYHELTALTALAARLPELGNHTMRIKEWKGEVVFLHEVAKGAADRSYGIQVARLAGLPEAVVARAHEVLEALEKGQQGSAVARLADDLPLFSAAAPRPRNPAADARASAVEAALKEIRPDDLSPREALEALYRLKGLMEEED